jgi:hypothetical protein
MQAFAWRHLVPADELLACVLRGGPQLGRVARVGKEPLALRPGGTAELVYELAGARRAMPQGITCTLRDPPPGFSVVETRVERMAFRVVLKADKSVPKGLAGNLLLEATVDRPATGDAAAKARPARQRLGLLLPAVPFLVGKS